jgi:flagellar biosynthesis protein FlhG
VAGGKGGIGKTVLATNTAIALANRGHKVAVIDFDSGGASLVRAMGLEQPPSTLLENLRNGECISACTRNAFGVSFMIAGESSQQGSLAELQNKISVLSCLKKLAYDFIILDMGPGTGPELLDYFLSSNLGIIVTTPEPTSLENAFVFMKALFHRKLSLFAEIRNDGRFSEWFEKASQKKELWNHPAAVLESFARAGSGSARLALSALQKTHIGIVMNQTRMDDDREMGSKLMQIANKNFAFAVDFLKFAEFDNHAWQASRQNTPVVSLFPDAPLSVATKHLAEQLRKRHIFTESK